MQTVAMPGGDILLVLQGPHREQPYSDLCSGGDDGESCRSAASVACLRCGAPLCPDHVPAASQRCPRCEVDYTQTAPGRADLLRSESRLVSISSAAIGVAVGVGSGLSLGWVAGLTGIVFTLGHWVRMLSHLAEPEAAGMAGLLLRRHRRKFLRERSRDGRPGPRALLGN